MSKAYDRRPYEVGQKVMIVAPGAINGMTGIISSYGRIYQYVIDFSNGATLTLGEWEIAAMGAQTSLYSLMIELDDAFYLSRDYWEQ